MTDKQVEPQLRQRRSSAGERYRHTKAYSTGEANLVLLLTILWVVVALLVYPWKAIDEPQRTSGNGAVNHTGHHRRGPAAPQPGAVPVPRRLELFGRASQARPAVAAAAVAHPAQPPQQVRSSGQKPMQKPANVARPPMPKRTNDAHDWIRTLSKHPYQAKHQQSHIHHTRSERTS